MCVAHVLSFAVGRVSRGVVSHPSGLARSPYAVGLIATDGCLIETDRQVAFVSQDLQLVEIFLACLGRPARYRIETTRRGTLLYRVQFKDAGLYRWLTAIGLTPRKSLTLGALAVPDDLLVHAVRGLLDGDGSIVNFVGRADTSRRSDYYYEWFRARFISASRPHVEWLQARIRGALGIGGSVNAVRSAARRPMHKLEFGKWDSIRLLSWVYADRTAPCLLRKRAIWDDYAQRHALDVATA